MHRQWLCLVCSFNGKLLLFINVTCVCKSLSCVWLLATPWLLCPWNSPGKNTGMGCHSPLQGIILIQGSNLGLLHCRQIFTIWTTWEALQIKGSNVLYNQVSVLLVLVDSIWSVWFPKVTIEEKKAQKGLVECFKGRGLEVAFLPFAHTPLAKT